jgi:hypothetical protein
MDAVPADSQVVKAASRNRFSRSMSSRAHQGATDERPTIRSGTIKATVVFEDSTIEHILLMGDDSDRFNRIRDHLDYGSVAAISISDQDGPAAVGWIDQDGPTKGLLRNNLASALCDRLILGPMVITGRGHGEQDTMTSIHEGMRLVLNQMARNASDGATGRLEE